MKFHIIFNRFNAADLEFPNGEKLCTDWLTGTSITNAIVYLTAVAIVVLNIIIVTVLKCKNKWIKPL